MPDRLKKRFPTASAPNTLPTATVAVTLTATGNPSPNDYSVSVGDVEVQQAEDIKFELSNSPSGATVAGVTLSADATNDPAPTDVFSPTPATNGTSYYGTANSDGSLTLADNDSIPNNMTECDYSFTLYVDYNGHTYDSDPKISNETGGGGGG